MTQPLKPVPRAARLALAGLAVLAGWLGGLPGALAQARPYTVDPAHTSVYFAASHFDRSTVRGRFGKIDGRILYDAAGGVGSLDFTVDTASVDSGLPPLDSVLRSAQFLDAQAYPYARLRAQRFLSENGRLVAVEGELSLHGVTRPVRLEATRFSCGEEVILGVRRHACGGDFHVTLSRSAFGMTRFLPEVSDAVTLSIAVEATPAAGPGPAASDAPAQPAN